MSEEDLSFTEYLKELGVTPNDSQTQLKHKNASKRKTKQKLISKTKYCLIYENWKNIDLSNNAVFFKSLKHLQEKHSDSYFTENVQFEVNLLEPLEKITILRQLNDIYLVVMRISKRKFCLATMQLSTWFNRRFIEKKKKIRIEMNSENVSLVKYCLINYKICNSYINTVETSIEDLKSVFGDILNVKIDINIESHVACHHCNTYIQLNAAKFSNRGGWTCQKCMNEILVNCYCPFEDIDEKYKKHNLFFCTARNNCLICHDRRHSKYFMGDLMMHYRKKHDNIIKNTQNTFKISKTNGKYIILNHNTELLICRYSMNETELRCVIRTPWQREEIARNRCFITLSPIVCGFALENETKTFQMQKLLDEFDDWRLELKHWTFKNWNGEFAVTIDIKNA